MKSDEFAPEEFASRLLAAFDQGSSLDPITNSIPALSMRDAYRIAQLNMAARIVRGETPVGWKIGFTNRTIWDEYDVHAPIWGPMYNSTVQPCVEMSEPTDWRVTHLHEPRIEPEIAFRLSKAPTPDLDEAGLLGCIDAVTHGFEIVQSPYRNWRFRPTDTVAAGALHGNFVHGPWHEIVAADHDEWLRKLSNFSVTLRNNEGIVDVGSAQNVLDGPLSALRHFVVGLAENPGDRSVLPGDIVTTGTVTRAFPVKPGDEWWSEIDGLPLVGLRIRCV